MRCPFCGHLEDKVVDSRESKEGDSIRRRRECLVCGRRFTSYERIDEIPYMVVKKDGKRETFERGKVMAGLLRACEKRPISAAQLESIVDEVEKEVQESLDRELPTSEIGKIIMRRLKQLDKVAYVRFASVYLEFEDVSEFMTELKYLVRSRDKIKKKTKRTKKVT
jgi:transcriptional repressor NrdR